MKNAKSLEELCIIASSILSETFLLSEDQKVKYTEFATDDYLEGYLRGYISTFLLIQANYYQALHDELIQNFDKCLITIYSSGFENFSKNVFTDKHFVYPPIMLEGISPYEFGFKRGKRVSQAYFSNEIEKLEKFDLYDSADGTVTGLHHNWFVVRVWDKFLITKSAA